MSSTILTPGSLLAQLNWRAAIQKFDAARAIPEETWHALEQSLVLAPSSFGLQPWKFLVVKDRAVRASLRAHAWDQCQFTDASHLVVLARRIEVSPHDVDRHIDRIAEVRAEPRETFGPFRSAMLECITGKDAASLSDWNARQVYLALGSFLTACAVLGVDACPFEGFDAGKFDQVLGLPRMGYTATVVAAAGFRASDDPGSNTAKVRFKPTDVVSHI